MDNQDRIRKWREQRAQEAASDRSERVRQAQEQTTVRLAQAKESREEELRAEERRRQEVAESLLPTPEGIAAEQQSALETRREQDLKKRRRLFAFVGLPVLLVAFYTLFIATPLYEAETTFAVETIEDNGVSPGIGLLGAGVGGSSLADAYRIREYLLSREAMAEMERRFGYLSHFEKGSVDPLTGPIEIPVLGLDQHDYYQRRVRITVDLQENLVRLRVHALDAEQAAKFANALIGLGREKITSISDRLNKDQINALEQNLADAERNVRAAAGRVAQVQRYRAEVDPQQTAASVYQIVSTLEVQLAEAENERSGLMANGLTESPLLPRLTARIAALRDQIADQRSRLVGGGGDGSVQRALVDFESAVAQKKLAESSLESMLRTIEQARLRALEQRRYLVVVAQPVPPPTATVGRASYLILLAAVVALLAYGLAAILRLVRQLRTA